VRSPIKTFYQSNRCSIAFHYTGLGCLNTRLQLLCAGPTLHPLSRDRNHVRLEIFQSIMSHLGREQYIWVLSLQVKSPGHAGILNLQLFPYRFQPLGWLATKRVEFNERWSCSFPLSPSSLKHPTFILKPKRTDS
jgi:hypothetical protein